MKKTTQDRYVTCTNLKRPKTYEVTEAKEKPGHAICPVCGEYHKLNKV